MAASLPPGIPLSQIPYGRPPPGVEPLNFVNPPTKEKPIIAVSAITVALATIFVIGRVYLNNANKGRKLGLDDGMNATSLAHDRLLINSLNDHSILRIRLGVVYRFCRTGDLS